MFNRPTLVINEAPSRPVHTTITEKRAPTDASVALLREMEAQAEALFISRFKVDNNGFTCKVLIAPSPMNFELRYIVLYALNGKEKRTNVTVREHATEDECVTALIKNLSEDLAREFLSEAFKGHRGSIKQPNVI